VLVVMGIASLNPSYGALTTTGDRQSVSVPRKATCGRFRSPW